MTAYGIGVERAGDPEGTGKGLPAYGDLEAVRRGMHVRPAPGKAAMGVCDQVSAHRHHAQQLTCRHPNPAADAGADRRAQPCSPGPLDLPGSLDLPGPSDPPGSAADGTDSPATTSGRMSMRQPVRRAARRAFCPSLPIASESW